MSISVLALAAVALLAVACGGGSNEGTAPSASEPAASTPAQPSGSGDAGSQTLDIAFLPTLKVDKTELRARAGAEITVKFNNIDSGIPHNWAVYRDEDFKEAIAGANENICTAPCAEQVDVGPLVAGQYYFRCDVHPLQMKGELLVE